mmetsp:Transcript_15770/g.44863  ORF Transcript_15770/g.44863 Transcript_15770/m.44863 type:complete len:206 (-) Transcript_15770:423-1040(-)
MDCATSLSTLPVRCARRNVCCCCGGASTLQDGAGASSPNASCCSGDTKVMPCSTTFCCRVVTPEARSASASFLAARRPSSSDCVSSTIRLISLRPSSVSSRCLPKCWPLTTTSRRSGMPGAVLMRLTPSMSDVLQPSSTLRIVWSSHFSRYFTTAAYLVAFARSSSSNCLRPWASWYDSTAKAAWSASVVASSTSLALPPFLILT